MMTRHTLPIGIQNLREIRERDCYCVDKTGLAIDLIESSGKAFFLSRPRRFGKSLLVETRWDWGRRHPVIRISLGSGVLRDRMELDRRIPEVCFPHRCSRLNCPGWTATKSGAGTTATTGWARPARPRSWSAC